MILPRSGSHTAPGRRPTNQDACLERDFADGRMLVALADGMGGHRAGEVASRCALAALASSLEQGTSLADAFDHAGREVFHAARQNEHWSGMGTTMVALLRTGDQYIVANVGDSRAYRIDGDGVRQLTRDHTLLAAASGAGGEAVIAARESRWRNALTRALGTEPHVEVDLFGPFSAVDSHTVLLCSDGLYRWLDHADLASVADHGAPDSAARLLVDRAYASGSGDNITAVVVRFGDPGQRAPDTIGTAPGGVARQGSEARRRRRRAERTRRALLELAAVLVMLIVVLLLLKSLA